MFSHYSARGPLYVVFDKKRESGHPKLQVWYDKAEADAAKYVSPPFVEIATRETVDVQIMDPTDDAAKLPEDAQRILAKLDPSFGSAQAPAETKGTTSVSEFPAEALALEQVVQAIEGLWTPLNNALGSLNMPRGPAWIRNFEHRMMEFEAALTDSGGIPEEQEAALERLKEFANVIDEKVDDFIFSDVSKPESTLYAEKQLLKLKELYGQMGSEDKELAAIGGRVIDIWLKPLQELK